jgi:hypothetical protein
MRACPHFPWLYNLTPAEVSAAADCTKGRWRLLDFDQPLPPETATFDPNLLCLAKYMVLVRDLFLPF